MKPRVGDQGRGSERRALLARFIALALALAMAPLAVAAEDRVEKRASELALPDPYLDPSWPDESGDELEDRYQAGRSDSVEEVPLDEEVEMREELRALEGDLGGLASPDAAVPPVGVEGEEGAAPPEDEPSLPPVDAPEMTDRPEPARDDFEKDPVEW